MSAIMVRRELSFWSGDLVSGKPLLSFRPRFGNFVGGPGHAEI